jgi:hypothetical protein
VIPFFFWTCVLFFANVSSPSLMGYGQLKYGPFTDLQQPLFAFSFPFGESNGFSGPVQSHLNSDAMVAHEWRHYPIQAAITRCPKFDAIALVLGVIGRLGRGDSFFSGPIVLNSQTSPRRL